MFGREWFGVEREREIGNNYVIWEDNCSVMRERIDTRCNYVIWEDNCSVMRELEVILCSEENCSELREREIRNNYVFIGRQLFGYESNYDMHRLVEATKLGYKRFCRERYEYQQMIDCR